MGFFDDIGDAVDDAKDTVDDAVDEAKDTVDDVKEGVGEAIDEAEDTVQEKTGVDLGGSGGGPEDTDTETTESTFSSGGGSSSSGGGGSSSGGSSGSSGGSSSGGSSTSTSSTGGSTSSSGSSSSGGSTGRPKDNRPENQPKENNQDKAPQTQEQLRRFLGVGKQKVQDAGKRLNQAVDEKDARDKDIINDDAFKEGNSDARLFETGAERSLSRTKNLTEANTDRELDNSFRANQFFTAQERVDQGKDKIQQLDQQIENIRSSENSEFIIDEKPEEEGGEKKVSKKELISTLESDKEALNEDISTIQENQLNRLENIQKTQEQIDKDRKNITEEEAEKIAKNKDLSEEGIKATFLGKELGEVKGGVAEASIIFDTALSSNSGELLGASVDQFVGSDENDKTVEEVAEKNAIQSGQRLKKQGFDPVDEGVDTLTSIPGIIGSSVVGGVAFSGGSKAISLLPKVGSQAQKVYQGAGAIAGAYTVGKQGQKAKGELDQGNEAKAVGTVAETGAGIFGFVKGQKGFNSKLGARKGTTDISQKNFLRQTGKDSAQGSGRFEAKTVVEKPGVRDYIDSARGKEFRPNTEVIRSQGRYGIPTASKGSSQAKGQIRYEFPNGKTETQGFEVLSSVKQSGTTRSGNKFRISSDNTRFKSEGRLFRNFRDKQEFTKTVKQGEKEAGPREVLNQFREVGSLKKDSNIKKTELTGTNAESNTFSQTTNFLVQKRGGGGTAGSSGGQGLKTGSKSGGAGSTNVRVRDVVNSKADSFVNSQNPGKVGSSGSSVVGSGSNTQAKQGGSGQSQEANTFSSSLSGQRLQNFRQNVYGNREITSTEEQGGQETKTEGRQITSRGTGSSTVSTEVTSTASNIIQDKKDRVGLNDSNKTGQRNQQGQKPKAGVGNKEITGIGQGQRNRLEVGQTGKVGQGLRITDTTKTGLTQVQQLKTKPVQQQQRKQVTGLQPVTTTSTKIKPGLGGPASLELQGGKLGGKPGTSSKGPNPGTGSVIKTDWFSANLVEQSTEEQARFDTSKNPRSQLFGLKAEQERSGSVESPKILESKNNGGKNIW